MFISNEVHEIKAGMTKEEQEGREVLSRVTCLLCSICMLSPPKTSFLPFEQPVSSQNRWIDRCHPNGNRGEFQNGWEQRSPDTLAELQER